MQYASVNTNENTLSQHFKLKPLFEYIDLNYNRLLTLEAMAKVIGVTPQYLCTLFKKIITSI